MKRPNKGGRRAPPQPGGESFQIGEAGEPIYLTPMPPVRTIVRYERGEFVCTPVNKPSPAPPPLLPTADELAALPRAARAAFAARCRERVRPLAPDAPADADPVAAVRDAVAALAAAATLVTPLSFQIRRIRRDFDRLARLAADQNWANDTPVPADVFGPLWPRKLTPPWAAPAPA